MKTQFGASSLVILTALGLAACSGQIGDDVSGGVTIQKGPDGTPVAVGPGEMIGASGEVCKTNASLASARISLISDAQFVNVVHDVFGVTYTGDVSTVASANGEYNVSESSAVSSQTTAQAYMSAADKVVADPAFKPCGAAVANVTASCMQTWLKDKLPLAWRRPVTDTEIANLMVVFNLGIQDTPARAVQITMEAALGSPNFLYRNELGDNATGPAGGKSNLNAYEVAAAVSFALTNSAPDMTLWSKAQDGSITQQAVLASEVQRIMQLPAARANLAKKASYYLNFEKVSIAAKDPMLYPDFEGLKPTLYQSSQMFLNDVLWKGTFTDLLTSKTIYANQAMAKLYGLPAVTGTTLVPVNVTTAAYSAGVLTQPALLATANKHPGDDDIVHRGLWVYNNLACGITIGDPPANAGDVFKTLTGTQHQRALKRDALAQCGTCHAAFDPFGLVTENYDPIGRYQTTDVDIGGPIDTSATIVRVGDDINGPVKDVNDLAQKFLSGSRASNCASTQLARFTLDHNPDVENSCLMQDIKVNFHKSGSFPELFQAILSSPAFLTRDL